VRQLIEKAEGAYAEKRLGEAASYAQTVLSGDSGNARAHNILGKIYYRSSKLDLALNEYRKALDGDSGFAEAKYNLGIVEFDTGNFRDAEHLLEEAAHKQSKIRVSI